MISLTQILPAGINKKANTFSLPKFNQNVLLLVLGFISICLLFLYIVNVNALTRGSYIVKEYDKKITLISDEKKNLEISFQQNNFLDSMQQKAATLGFSKVDRLKYVQISNDLNLARAK